MLLNKRKPILTEGPILSKIIMFVLPLMAANLLQTLYNAADIMIVELSGELDAVGAIGTTSSFTHLIVNLFIGFATGSNVIVARHLGAKNEETVSKAVHTSLTMSLIFGIGAAIIGIALSRPILSLIGAEEGLLDLATLYTQIYFLGAPFMAVTNYSIAILRAKGDTKTPLYILSFSGILNVLLNLSFVIFFNMSVEGVAIATAIANAVSAALLVLKLTREDSACRFSFKKMRIHMSEFLEILHVGIPAAIQASLFSISNMLIQSSILQVNNNMCPPGSEYQPIVKGNSAASNLESFAFTAVNAVHQAAITFSGQNAGAKKYDRVVRITYMCYFTSLFVSAAITAIIYLLRNPLFALYGVTVGTDALSAMAYNAATKRLQFHLLPFVTFSFMDTGSGIARGLKKAISSTVLTLIGTCVFRVVWIFTIFRAIGNLESIFISYPLSWIITGIAQMILVIITIRKCKRTTAMNTASIDQ